MAAYLELQVGRINRLMQKLWGIKVAPRPVCVPEVQHQIALFHGAENRYLEGWERFSVWVSFAAVAASSNTLRLRNPASSNVVAVIEKIGFSGSADTPVVEHGPQAADLATPSTGNRWDPRGRPVGAMIASIFQSAASQAFNFVRWQGGNPTSAAVDVITAGIQEFPLLPGDAVQIRGVGVNIAEVMFIWWRERVLEDSERT